jgi:hypothetical protein
MDMLLTDGELMKHGTVLINRPFSLEIHFFVTFRTERFHDYLLRPRTCGKPHGCVIRVHMRTLIVYAMAAMLAVVSLEACGAFYWGFQRVKIANAVEGNAPPETLLL